MSFKKTVIFFIILALLGGYYYFQVGRSEKQQAEEEAAKKLFTLTEEDIQEITLKQPEQEILLKKQDDRWKMVKPVEALADTENVERMLTEFVAAERDNTITENTSQDEEFGLDPPELIVTAKGQDAEAQMQLSLGQQTPVATGYYARVGETPQVITVSNAVKTALEKSVYDLRDKTVLDFDPQQVKKAIFSMKKSETGELQTIELEQSAGAWKITSPKEDNADNTKMGSILSKVKSSKIKAFISENAAELAQYGLDQPTTTLSLLVGADSSRKTLLLGQTNAEQDGVYAKHAGAANVFLVPANITEEFPQEIDDVRDKTLLSFNNADVQKIEFTSPAETIVVERGATQDWRITQPEELEADSSKVNRILSDAGLLEVEQFVTAETEDLARYGLDPANLSFRIWESEQDSPQELLLGSNDAENTGIYAKLAEQPSVVLIKDDALEKLHKTALDLQYTKILTFEQPQVEKIKIEYADVTFLLEKNEDAWEAKEPEKKTLVFYKVNNLVYDLQGLEFTQKISEPEESLSAYGLEQPEVKVTLWDQEQKEIDTLVIGKQVEGQDGRYVKTASENTVYAIESAFLAELPKEMADITE